MTDTVEWLDGLWKNWFLNKRTQKCKAGAYTYTLIYVYNTHIKRHGTHIFLFISTTHPVQPCGNKADALFSPYVLLKRVLFDLKLIGQAWAQGLKAWTAGLSTAAHSG